MRYHKRKPIRLILLIVVIILAVCVIGGIGHRKHVQQEEAAQQNTSEVPDYIDVQLLDINEYSRPGIALKQVDGIVIHYTANPGSTAQENRDYFNNLQTSHTTKVSSHFVVGIDGEVIQCIPTVEMSYASNSRNTDTIAIECCYEAEDGSFTRETYDSLVKLTAFLCDKYGLTGDDVIRHYDITGKMCPLYYVNHPDEWEAFRKDVDKKRNK